MAGGVNVGQEPDRNPQAEGAGTHHDDTRMDGVRTPIIGETTTPFQGPSTTAPYTPNREEPVAGLRPRVLLMTDVLGELLIQRRLQPDPGQLLEQPVRPRQRQAL